MKKKNYTTPRVLVMYIQQFSIICASGTSTYKVNDFNSYNDDDTIGDGED